jgi:ABC-type glycerol-3-phosphate transport system permease component
MIYNRKLFQKIGLFALTLPVYIMIFLPVIWLVSSSISNRSDLLALPATFFPKHPTLENYINIFIRKSHSEVSKTFIRTLGNSFLLAVRYFYCLFVVSLAAYELAASTFLFGRGDVGYPWHAYDSGSVLWSLLYIYWLPVKFVKKTYRLIVTYLSFALTFAI